MQKAEKLYALSRDEYAAAEKRFDDAEGKIARYLSILFVVLGIATLSVDTLKTAITKDSAANFIFIAMTVLSYLSGIIAFGCFLYALAIQRVRGVKLDGSVSKYFDKYTMEAALRGLSPAYFNAASQFRRQTQRKLNRASRGYKFLICAAIFAVLSAGSYLFVESSETTMMSIGSGENNGNGGEESAPNPEPSDDAAQAEQEAEHLFEEIQKGFEGSDDTEER